MVRLRLTLAFCVLAVAPLLGGGEPWERKPPAEWTQEEALALLNDSPWAQRVSLMQVSGRLLGQLPDGSVVVHRDGASEPPRRYSVEPVSIEPELVEAVYVVRWSSAAMVQQALARLEETNPVLREMQAPPAELSAQHYVLTARVVEPPTESAISALRRPPVLRDESGRLVRQRPPSVSDIFAGLGEDELKARAELHTAGKLRLKPERVARHGVGASEGISFFFPRQQDDQPTLPPETEWAEFVFEGVKGDKLKAKFKLKDLQRKGERDY